MTLTIVSFSTVRLSAIISVIFAYCLVCAKFAHEVLRSGMHGR